MFDPAPEWSAQSNEQVKEALSFGNRVKCHAQKYVVFSEHRIFMIRKCCAYLETLMEDKKGLVWPNDQREPIEEFQNVMQILIYTICDDEFLFDGAGYFKAKPNTENPNSVGCLLLGNNLSAHTTILRSLCGDATMPIWN